MRTRPSNQFGRLFVDVKPEQKNISLRRHANHSPPSESVISVTPVKHHHTGVQTVLARAGVELVQPSLSILEACLSLCPFTHDPNRLNRFIATIVMNGRNDTYEIFMIRCIKTQQYYACLTYENIILASYTNIVPNLVSYEVLNEAMSHLGMVHPVTEPPTVTPTAGKHFIGGNIPGTLTLDAKPILHTPYQARFDAENLELIYPSLSEAADCMNLRLYYGRPLKTNRFLTLLTTNGENSISRRPDKTHYLYALRVKNSHHVVAIIRFDSVGKIDQLHIDDAYQGKGLGKYLLASAIHLLRETHQQQVILVVATSNSLAFYLKLGFDPCDAPHHWHEYTFDDKLRWAWEIDDDTYMTLDFNKPENKAIYDEEVEPVESLEPPAKFRKTN